MHGRRSIYAALVVSLAACSSSKRAPVARDDAPLLARADAGAPADAASPDLPRGDTSWTRSHDFDGDGQRDSVAVDYTNGAHCCYKLTVSLSASGRHVALPFDIDGGYAQIDGLTLDRPENFTVEVGRDGVSSLVMAVATYSGRLEPIPLEWVRRYGIRSHRIRVSLRGGDMKIDNLPWSCGAALDAVVHRRFASWEGWPAACAFADIALALDVQRAPGNDASLGSAGTEATLERVSTMVSADARYVALDVYQRDGHVVRIDLDESALLGSVDDLVTALGSPDARLPYSIWGFVHPTGQWVWSSRGLVVYVDRAGRTIRHAAVFTPTDLTTYRRDLAWPSGGAERQP